MSDEVGGGGSTSANRERRIQRFEDLVAWQRARQLTGDVYAVIRTAELSRDYGLSSQMQRSAVSIMANIAEGYERGSPGDFHRFLAIAKGSCAELRSHLYVAQIAGHIDAATFDRLRLRAEEVGRLVGGLQVSVAKRRDNGKRSQR